jgi:hypothetical protein
MLVSWLILRPWSWKRHVPPQRRLTSNGRRYIPEDTSHNRSCENLKSCMLSLIGFSLSAPSYVRLWVLVSYPVCAPAERKHEVCSCNERCKLLFERGNGRVQRKLTLGHFWFISTCPFILWGHCAETRCSWLSDPTHFEGTGTKENVTN